MRQWLLRTLEVSLQQREQYKSEKSSGISDHISVVVIVVVVVVVVVAVVVFVFVVVINR